MPKKAASKKAKAKKSGSKRSTAKKTSGRKASVAKKSNDLMTKLSTAITQITAAAKRITAAANEITPIVTQRRAASRFESPSGSCIDLLIATQIVQNAAKGPHDIDKKLREVEIISDNQLRVFQEDVFEGVLDVGCDINRGDIPNDPDNTLREVRTAVRAAAH